MPAGGCPRAEDQAGAAEQGALPTHYRPTHAPSLTPPTNGSQSRGYNLFVGTLPAGTQRDDLEILFSPFGSLTDVYMLKQEGLGGRRCGFVSFGEHASAALAIWKLNGFVIREGELPICVRFANPVKAKGAEGARGECKQPAAPPGSIAGATMMLPFYNPLLGMPYPMMPFGAPFQGCAPPQPSAKPPAKQHGSKREQRPRKRPTSPALSSSSAGESTPGGSASSAPVTPSPFVRELERAAREAGEVLQP
eukprot:TRINITY_DN5392_c0_g1_i1.p4 TRINITY_DN5392_c0_g1~~TRINITY_DN5392_c0_g1_i1.p4  ORF type:complete len:272 (+),score=70.94 TRINITY_DN5392_c0_g1_i1:68-817(+)